MAMMKRKNPTVIRSTLGHSVYFPGGDEAVFVAPILQGLALEAGAEFVDEAAKGEYTKEQDEKLKVRSGEGPSDPAQRSKAINEAVALLAKANSSDDFTAGGLPKVKSVIQTVGFRVDITEVRTAWEAFTQAPFKEV